MSEKCPKCQSEQINAEEWDDLGVIDSVFWCDSRIRRSDGAVLESSTCLRRQLAQKDRELEQAKADSTALMMNCESMAKRCDGYMEMKEELEQSRQREAAKDAAMSWSKAAWWRLRAMEPTDDGFPEACDKMDAAFIDAPKVLAVVDRKIKRGCDPYEERGVIYIDGVELDDVAGIKSVRVIVLGRDESEG